MTWSIIARDPLTGQIGIAVATRFFAVGARVPHIAPGIGGVATQALVNPYYGIDGVKLLREGNSPREVAERTAPLARYVAENFDSLPKPYRSYREGYVYRNEEPGPGRFRQFMQFDAETRWGVRPPPTPKCACWPPTPWKPSAFPAAAMW